MMLSVAGAYTPISVSITVEGTVSINRRGLIRLSFILAAALSMPTAVMAQQKSLKDQLIGTWTFVSASDTNKDGTKTDRWGANAKGLAIFEANGRYSFMISRSDIPKFAIDNANQGTAEENRAAIRGVISHIGTWSVDEATKTLVTAIEASNFPNLNGISQKRIIGSLTGNELKYTNPASSTGAVSEVTWKRVP
jgi:Lipocalin-like domain